MIRSLAARNLSARQKSSIRNIAYRLGGYTRRPVEVLVEDVVLNDGARTFLQIGAMTAISPIRSASVKTNRSIHRLNHNKLRMRILNPNRP
ncbi:hypothetical protein KMZ29_14575 [Bradyrhizobium sediminis]|uniref:Uncharacterized protein n=1 Tax=Bradyrhizobium sediminis TaxID=2840469 RepID=A0A975RK23_9BRAD|nr:hypothetical protein [Bradyrhizobium sediminis]QWG11007.1 hypothetical protein KMZ29_14575 [Bradyrhizobium sediminis]